MGHAQWVFAIPKMLRARETPLSGNEVDFYDERRLRQSQDTVGFALGYRFRSEKVRGLKLHGISPFLGITRAENDILDEETMMVTGTKTEVEWIAGISLNLDTALGWLKNN